jgi:potassium/hydrogen antiporter
MEAKTIVELNLPQEFLIILIARENEFIQPSGGTTLQANDTLIVLSDRDSFALVEFKLHASMNKINRS